MDFKCKKCWQMIPLKMKGIHKMRCKKEKARCSSCRKVFIDLVSHERSCAIREVACSICQVVVRANNLEKHESECRKECIRFSLCSEKQVGICSRCSRYNLSQNHVCSSVSINFIFGGIPKFILERPRLKNNFFKRILLQKERNNIAEHFERNQLTLALINSFSANLPCQLKSEQHQEESIQHCKVMQWTIANTNFLPLQIRDTKTNKGFGVFATRAIKKDSLVCLYMGFIIGTCDLPFLSNDLYDINCQITFGTGKADRLMILPIPQCSGFGRFINGSIQNEENCNPYNVFATIKGFLQPLVVIVASKDIPIGHEILYSYGQSYWKQSVKNQGQKEISKKFRMPTRWI